MYKSRIRNAKEKKRNEKAREIEFPDDGQLYAVVERMLGNGRVEVYCEDEVKRTVRIRGSMRKFKSKVIIEPSDLVLVSPWDFETDKGDLIHKYTHEEVTYMMYQEMVPDTIHKKIQKNAGGDFGVGKECNDEYIVFANTELNKTEGESQNRFIKGLRKDNENDTEHEEKEEDIDIDDI